MTDKVNSYLAEYGTPCVDILTLSYKHLPRYLESSFIYLGMFPDDLHTRYLMRLWVAEGFIQQIGDREVDGIVKDYLEKLIDRRLIQVASKRSDGERFEEYAQGIKYEGGSMVIRLERTHTSDNALSDDH
ncbi:hypothetical protein FNV43_RR00810 [Rhamnella rubrinervis]|uniref:Disease resistance protein winged helix domain-containing protein n=1 Tax=Rhamnella rubrinervis TaxID=2594499 RepID=A0A8K0HPB4_9ROSA|nr:hypothetical protein FNV43_RR00810 [Rhamnella rubrinervis]